MSTGAASPLSSSTTGAKPTLKLPWPHPGQRHVLLRRKRFTWLAAGRRWRKTTLALHPVFETVLQGGTVIWGAPTYDQVFTSWEEHQRAARRVASFNQSRMTMHLGKGAVLFRSLDDPDNVRSKTANGIVLDEVGDIAAGAWVETLRPMLMDTDGWLLAIGSPKGRNWFWQEWQRANSGDATDAAAFQAPTLGCRITGEGLQREPHPLENPEIKFEEVLHLWQTMPERVFRQEILAEFVEDGGGVFRYVRAAQEDKPYERPTDMQFVIGADWGRSHDYTVFTVVDTTGRVVAIDRSNAVDYAVQRDRLRALWERWGKGAIIAEENSMGRPIIEQLSREGMRVRAFTTTNATKAVIIEALALAFERRLITLPDHSILIGELEAFESSTLPSGLTRYSAPDGFHDDCVMSLALAWSGITRTSRAVGAFQ